jgi:hypothetical protein
MILNVILLNAQIPVNYHDRELFQSQLKELSAIYDSSFNIENHILNGRVFYASGNKYINPFFLDNEWKTGKIWSSGLIYNAKMLKYDIGSDNLVYLNYKDSYAYPVYLNREFVKEFIIGNHHFKYLNDFGNSNEDELKPGYYEVLYNGVIKYYVRWEKIINPKRSLSDQGYTQKNFFFLKKDGKYIRLKSQSTIFKILTDHEKEIRTFMKKNNIHFSVNKLDTIVRVFEYYDKL